MAISDRALYIIRDLGDAKDVAAMLTEETGDKWRAHIVRSVVKGTSWWVCTTATWSKYKG